MLVGSPPPPAIPKRWPRGQKFALSAAGVDAEGAHRAAVLQARASGRAALDAALAAWASPHGVDPQDGVVMGELRGKPRGLTDLGEALVECGIDAGAVRAAVDRLVAAGLVSPVPLASQVGI